MQLSEIDYKILKHIHKNEPVRIDKLKIRKINDLDYRIACLMNSYEKMYVLQKGRNSNYLVLSDAGRKALFDYRSSQKYNLKNMWLKNAWIPICVSLITNLLIIGIKLLLPLIKELLSNFL